MNSSVKIDEVVKSLLIQQGEYTEHKYMQYLDLALRGLKELSFDVLMEVKVATLSVNTNLTVDLPCDYVNYTRIGVCKPDGRIYTLGVDEQICLSKGIDVCGNEVANDGKMGSTWIGNYRNGESTGGVYGLGGGQNANGYYRIDRENNQIALSSDVEHTEIVLEYISDGSNVNGDNTINTLSEEALRAYIYWKSIQRKRNSTGQDRELARRDWYNEKRLARARVLNFTPDQAKRITRKGFKQSPRF